MSVLIILLTASITIAAIFLAAFLWSVKHGQFDDETSPPIRMLFDDITPLEKEILPLQTNASGTLSKTVTEIKNKP